MWFYRDSSFSLSIFATMRLVFSMDVGLISPIVTVFNVAGVGGVFGWDEPVNDVRLGIIFGWSRVSSTVEVVGDVNMS